MCILIFLLYRHCVWISVYIYNTLPYRIGNGEGWRGRARGIKGLGLVGSWCIKLDQWQHQHSMETLLWVANHCADYCLLRSRMQKFALLAMWEKGREGREVGFGGHTVVLAFSRSINISKRFRVWINGAARSDLSSAQGFLFWER